MTVVDGFKNEDDNESNVDPPWELGADDSKVALFFKPKPVPNKLEDNEGGEDEEEDLQFMAYSPPIHMHNVDLLAEEELEFAEL